eukprot:281284-Chlamydomonas_euryale.AAC.1
MEHRPERVVGKGEARHGALRRPIPVGEGERVARPLDSHPHGARTRGGRFEGYPQEGVCPEEHRNTATPRQ